MNIFIPTIISIISSIINFFYTKQLNENNKRKSLVSGYYIDRLIRVIPAKIDSVHNKVENKPVGIDDLRNEMIELRIYDIKSMKLIDKKSFDKWSDKIMDIEDVLTAEIDKSEQEGYDKDKKEKFDKLLYNKINELYKMMMNTKFSKIVK